MTTNNTVVFPAVNGNPIDIDVEIANLRKFNVSFETMLQTFVSANIHKNLIDYHICEICRIYGKTESSLRRSFRDTENNQRMIQLIGSLPDNAEDFVKKYIKHNNYDITFDNQFQIGNNFATAYDIDDMASRIYAESNTCNLNYKAGDINFLTRDFYRIEKYRLKESYKDRIAYDNRKSETLMKEALNSKLNELAMTLTNKNIEETALVLHHWMWQVKRKLFNLKVTDHMMVVLFGNQGCGKTYFIKKFTSPLEKFTVDINLADAVDNKAMHLRENYYIMIVDEMAKANKTEIDDLKRIITSEKTDTRKHFSHDVITAKTNSTMIGSTNKAISSILFDDTGMRRFFEINCLDQLDWDKINNFDYITLWKLVNENDNNPLRNPDSILTFQNIQEMQNILISEGPLESFVIERISNQRGENITSKLLKNEPYSEKLGATDLYYEYKEWSIKNGYKVYNMNNFRTNLLYNVTKILKGLKITYKRLGPGMFYYFEYDSDFFDEYTFI